jgi:hypothetical protein
MDSWYRYNEVNSQFIELTGEYAARILEEGEREIVKETR